MEIIDLPIVQAIYDAISRALPRALRGYLDPAIVVLAAVLLGVLLRVTLFRWLRWLTTRNQSRYDDIVVTSLTGRVVAWMFLGALYYQCEDLPWRPRTIVLTQNIVAALLIASVTLELMRMISALIQTYGTTSAAGVGGTTLIRYLAAVVLLFVGTVSILALFGISVVPAITALGIGGLAVALAFQDTLANVFSGLNLTLAGQVRVGDYIKLGEDVDGFVVDIGWRATTLRTLAGLIIFIPNKKLAETAMTNYTRDPGMSIELVFRTGLDCDPERVETIVLDEIQQAAQALPGIRTEVPACVRFKAFGDWALEFNAYVDIVSFQDRMVLRHELMKRLHHRLKREQIAVPVPQLRVDALAATSTTTTTTPSSSSSSPSSST